MQEIIFGFGYKLIRYLAKCWCYGYQFITGKPRDLESVVLFGHKLITRCKQMHVPLYIGNAKPNTLHEVHIHDLTFANPITFSAYEAHIDLLTLFFRLGIGGGCFKTMMPQPRLGNKRPRLQEVRINQTPALLNAMGLPGKGAQHAIDEILSSALLTYNRPLGLSIGGESLDEYKETFLIYNNVINHHLHPFYYEINMSCPNTDKGKQLSEDITILEQLIQLMRQETQRVISVKISPDQSNEQLMQLAECLQSYDKMMLTAGNTKLKQCTDVGLPPTAISRGAGGLSGDPLFVRTLAITQLLKESKIPLIATGGINSFNKITTVLNEGATLVGMATALVFNPYQITNWVKKFQEK